MVQNIWFKGLYYSVILLFLFSLKVFSQASEILAGASSVNITPPLVYPHYRGESTGAHDSLYAKALVIKQGEITLALVISDLLWVERSLSSSARLQISEKSGQLRDYKLARGPWWRRNDDRSSDKHA